MAGVARYEDLETWQLCVHLRDEIFKLTTSGPIFHDRKLREQIRNASSSAPPNIAEGFGRFRPRQFAQFVRIARASLNETQNHIQDGRTKKYFTEQESKDLLKLTHRCLGATTNFLRYLESCRDEVPTDWRVDDEGDSDERQQPMRSTRKTKRHKL